MSPENDFPALVRAHLPSVWAVELLLLLCRDPERQWQAKALTDELRASLPMVQATLERFERSGLATCNDDDTWRYSPASPVLEAFAANVAVQYRERPVSLINLIVAADDRIQQLADAFRFKGSERK